MLTTRIRATLVVLAASAGLAGCTSLGPYGGIGVGVGNQYGYGNSGYGYDPYYAGYGYNSGYGSAYGYNPYGWYNGYYYPGAGYWVYDRDRERRELTPEERAYWLERIRRFREARRNGTTAVPTGQEARENWSGFNRPTADAVASGSDTASRRDTVRQRVLEQRAARAERAQPTAEQRAARSERMEARRQEIQERREARPERRRPQE